MPMDTPEQIDAFKNVAMQQGYDPKEVEGFIGMAKAASASKQAAAQAAQQQELADYENKLKIQQKYSTDSSPFTNGVYDPNKDETLQRQFAIDEYKKKNSAGGLGEISEAETKAIQEGIATMESDGKGGYKVVPKKAESDPLQWAAENQVTKFLTGKDKDTRYAQAQAIQKMGVDGYLKASALTDLLSEDEQKARNDATSVLNLASTIASQVQGSNGKAKNASGVGMLGGWRPGFTLGTEGTAIRQNLTDLTATKLKALSGSTVSEQEFARLSQSLPQVGDTEGKILEKSKNIADSIQIGLQMQELAKRERLTIDEAYKKYGSDAFNQKGQPVPAWLKGSSQTKPGLNDVGNKKSNAPTKSGRFTIEVE